MDVHCRIKPTELFTIDGDGWLSAVHTLLEDTYTMAVTAHNGDLIDAALIVVHVQDASVSASSERDRTALVVIAIVCGVLVLLLAVVITLLIVVHRSRYVIRYTYFDFHRTIYIVYILVYN